MGGLEKAQASRRIDSENKRARVRQAIQLAAARGEVPSVSSVARAAGVDRSIFYGERGRPLRAELDLAIVTLQAELATGTSTTGRVTAATLRADLATANELNKRLRRRLTGLEAELARHHGTEILQQLPADQRAAAAQDQATQVERDTLRLRVAELEHANQQLEEDLDASRRANRSLTRQLNAHLVSPPGT